MLQPALQAPARTTRRARLASKPLPSERRARRHVSEGDAWKRVHCASSIVNNCSAVCQAPRHETKKRMRPPGAAGARSGTREGIRRSGCLADGRTGQNQFVHTNVRAGRSVGG
jgi:hypothetical protein